MARAARAGRVARTGEQLAKATVLEAMALVVRALRAAHAACTA